MAKKPYDQFAGNDNYGKPKSAYLERIASMTNEQLAQEAERKIWLSGYANNNPRSDFHWHVDAIYAECQKRDPEMYKKAYDAVLAGL